MILSDDIYSDFNGHIVRFLSLTPSEPSNWTNLRDVHLLPITKVTEESKYTLYVDQILSHVRRHIEDFRPDIIHVQHLGFGMALALSQIEEVPKISLCHGTEVLYAQTSEFFKQQLFRVYENCAKIVFPTIEMFKQFNKLTSLQGKETIIPWGIPESFFTGPRKWATQKANKNILYAGRFTINKNVELLIKTLKQMPRSISLTIIGEGSSKPNIISYLHNIGLDSQVKIIEFMPRSELLTRFDLSDALIMPTNEVEAFGLVAVEAQARGLPVIYAMTGGLNEVLKKSAIGFEPGNAQDLANKITKLFEKTENLEKVSKRGFRNSQMYRLSKLINSLESLSVNVMEKSFTNNK